MAFPHPFVLRNDISTALGKKWWLLTFVYHFFPWAVEISFLKDVEMPQLFFFVHKLSSNQGSFSSTVYFTIFDIEGTSSTKRSIRKYIIFVWFYSKCWKLSELMYTTINSFSFSPYFYAVIYLYFINLLFCASGKRDSTLEER